MIPLLSARCVTKSFAGVLANDAVDIDLMPKEIHALLGENGAGKSTLMQILFGQYSMDSGQLSVDGAPVRFASPRDAIRSGIGMIHQEFMLVDRFTVAENILLGLTGPSARLSALKTKMAEITRRFGLSTDLDATVDTLSIGQRQTVEILKLLYRDVRVLILDEPTAVLSPHEIAGFFDMLHKLAVDGRAIVIVTHKLAEVLGHCDRVTVMRSGRVVGRRNIADSTADGLAVMMVGRDVTLTADRADAPATETRLTVSGLTVLQDDGRRSLSDVSFMLRSGEILGVAGIEGNGQAQLAGALMNLIQIAAGTVIMDDRDVTHLPPADHYAAGMGYVPGDRRGVGAVIELSVGLNAILGRHHHFATWSGTMVQTRIETFAAGLIDRYTIQPGSSSVPAGKLSGGNLQKVITGRELARAPRVLVIEHPTRGLDVGAIEQLRAEISQARRDGLAVLLITSDLEEIFQLSDRIAVMHEGRIVGIRDSATVTQTEIGLMMSGSAPQ